MAILTSKRTVISSWCHWSTSGINGTHGLNDAYLPQRIPFDQAYAASK